ncbi:IS3 family transposase, partial [Corynebacterium casei]|uniref:IS3 family transposase n=2 Tax=Corynebacterium casei TaxID=160386 RepID=UPI003FD53181
AFALIYRFDEEGTHQQPRFTVTMMARLLRVSRAGYYGWKKRRNQNYPLSTPRGFRDQIADDVKEIFAKHNGFAGVRTIATELGTRGITATLYAVRKTMRKLGGPDPRKVDTGI